MNKPLEIINRMNKVELSAAGDLADYVKKMNAKTSEVKAFASKFKQLKQEYDKMESTLNDFVRESQNVVARAGVYTDPVIKAAAELGVSSKSIKEMQQWEAAGLELLGEIQQLINLGE
jgi:hypothetical protein